MKFSRFLTQSQHVLSLQGGQQQTSPETVATAGLEQFIFQTMEEWHVPGLAVAVIDGKSSWAKGFGHARINSTAPVTPYTQFFTGSTTKSFTAAAMAQVVDSSQFPHITWDTPISSLIRDDFVLSDPWATEHITIADALSHRTGYPDHDFVSYASPREAVRNLRNLPMSAEPRARYQYSNQLVTTIGYLIQNLYYPNDMWHGYLGLLGYVFQTKIWAPLGMGWTYLSTQFPHNEDPYRALADELWWHNDSKSYVVVPHAVHAGHEGAGMVVSCVADYVKWLRFMMGETRNEKVLSEKAKAAIKEPRIMTNPRHPMFTGPLWYAMGWGGGIFEGEEFWSHNGQMREHRTEMWMFPGKQFGVVIMANANGPAIEMILWRILYDKFEVPEEQRFNIEKRAQDVAKTQARSLETCVDRLYPRSLPPLSRPLPLTAYTGIYDNAGYGNFTIGLECGDSARKGYPADTPAHTTVEKGCALRGSGFLEFEGKAFHVDFEHVTGDYWVAWLFVDDYAPADLELTVRPQLCLRAQFRTGPDGAVEAFSGDFRREAEDGPLVWYVKRKTENVSASERPLFE
ncbi:beta-lactamase/transpeptidase-like protein [Echria macrotheca]|uniref:Beta-lactamase/transpeptidase-like protein n=1 Tax=Echria macrotheca TaxID=438768 RepID=A0AAJ0BGR5_9PEZI|nr:beta-lactamase/transpeptidase-like protein [Echria macrotheca]